jgi:hypothetical protein
MAVLTGGRRFWLWRAVDDEGEVLEDLSRGLGFGRTKVGRAQLEDLRRLISLEPR